VTRYAGFYRVEPNRCNERRWSKSVNAAWRVRLRSQDASTVLGESLWAHIVKIIGWLANQPLPCPVQQKRPKFVRGRCARRRSDALGSAHIVAAAVAHSSLGSFPFLDSQRFAHLPFQYSCTTNATRGRRKSPTSAISSLISLSLGVIFFPVVVRFIVGRLITLQMSSSDQAY
jgi:hypothetical protein